MYSPPRSLRSRKASTEVDIATLIIESEERIKGEIRALSDRLCKMEGTITVIQTECVMLDDEIKKIKQVVINQQKLIERNEEKNRANNLIVHNLPETEISHNKVTLKSDADKLSFISKTTGIDIDQNDIVSTHRLGKKCPNKTRPTKIILKNKELKHKALSKRKEISQSPLIHSTFGAGIFINPDDSFLVQKELYRLRQKLKEMKTKDPNCKPYIRSRVLYLDGSVIDEVNIENQLF